MQHGERSRLARVGRTALIVIGVAGGFAAFDAALLFVFLLLSAIVIAPLGPYAGVVLFLVLPAVAVFGGALASTAYLALHDEDGDGDQHADVRT